jgi:hypothetical protein
MMIDYIAVSTVRRGALRSLGVSKRLSGLQTLIADTAALKSHNVYFVF